jgi:hypothetical protein
MMSMRAAYVLEELRATIINIFRIPLNAFVCIVLGNVSGLGLEVCWLLYNSMQHTSRKTCRATQPRMQSCTLKQRPRMQARVAEPTVMHR